MRLNGSTQNQVGVAAAALLALCILATSPAFSQGTLFVQGNRVGVGVEDPDFKLHVHSTDGTAKVQVTEASGTTLARELFKLENNGGPFFIFANSAIGQSISFAMGSTGNFNISHQQTAGVQFVMTPTGNLTIQGTLTQGSSREIKDRIQPVDHQAILAKIEELPVATWHYKDAADNGQHVGPMAEDFRRVFGFGASDKHLSPSDVAGVTLAAVQGILTENRELMRANQELANRLAELEEAVRRLTSE